MVQHMTTLWKRWFSTSVPAGETPAHYLKLATEFLRQSEDMTGSLKGRRRFSWLGRVFLRQVQFHHVQLNRRQCAYLVEKLEMAVKSAEEFMDSSSPEQISESTKNCNLLARLAMDVKSFVQECCKAEWIQAANMVIDAFERVASLDNHLDICVWSFKNRNRIILGTALRRELTNISKDQDRRLSNQVKLLKNVEAALNPKCISNSQVSQRATSLLEGLEAAVADNPISDKPDLVALSVRDQVDLLRKVEAALSSECISNLEERQLAISLLERFRAAVANPVSDEPHLDLMRVDCKSLKRENLIGKGSFGDVYKVKWLGTPAAEKTLPQDKEGNMVQADFDKEVSILARLSHSSIVRLLCYVKEGATCSVVQELMEKDLTKLIEERMGPRGHNVPRREFPFSIDEVVDVMLQIAEGMDYLHRKRVLHRDLKSQNILVKREKIEGVAAEFVYAKVADFGFSKTRERSITMHNPTKNIGTTRWMAPELIHYIEADSAGNNNINLDDGFVNYPFRSDVFSFGMVCFEILTGDVPFANFYPNTVKKKVLEGERPTVPSHCPPCLAGMIKKCWRAEPKERPSFAEICTELRFMKGSLLMGRNL